MEEIKERKVILFIHLLLTERSKFMYWVRQQYCKTAAELPTNLKESPRMWILKREKRSHHGRLPPDLLLLSGVRVGSGCKFSRWRMPYFRNISKVKLNVSRHSGPVYTTLHIYLYFKSNIFTVHKDSFPKAVAMATNQGNHSNNPVLCTALIVD